MFDKLKTQQNQYYEAIFQEMALGKTLSWNWAACAFGPLWMLYHRLYLFAALYLLFMLQFQQTVTAILTLLLLQGSLGNKLYYQWWLVQKKSQEKVEKKIGSNTRENDLFFIGLIALLWALFASLSLLQDQGVDVETFFSQGFGKNLFVGLVAFACFVPLYWLWRILGDLQLLALFKK